MLGKIHNILNREQHKKSWAYKPRHDVTFHNIFYLTILELYSLHQRLIACTNTHLGTRLSYALPLAHSLHTHTSSWLLKSGATMTPTYTHPYKSLIACTNVHLEAHSSFTLSEVFTLHGCSITRDLRTVGRVFLVESVVLQTVLWNIRAFSAHFLVNTLKDLEIFAHLMLLVKILCILIHSYTYIDYFKARA